MIAITSFSPKGFDVYGKKFLESAVENWPTPIVCYVDEVPDFVHELVTYKLLKEINGYLAFQKYCESNPVFCGRIGGGYNFNHDARRFSHKVFSQFDALTHYTGKVFWLDADMVFKKPVPKSFLTDVFDDKSVCLLMREGLHAESGFVGFDTDRSDFDAFFQTYLDIYRRGKLFGMRYWIDGHAIQEAVKSSGSSYKNLSPFFRIPTDRKMTLDDLDVMNKSVLGEYIQHNKGPRKYAYQ